MKATILLLMATLPALAVSYDGCVKGNLFYNDMRYDGLFAWRKTESGTNGQRDPFAATPGQTHYPTQRNWLGALDVTVKVYEIDSIGRSLVGTDRVAADGSWSVSYTGLGDWITGGDPEIAVEFVLEFDGSKRAFQVQKNGSVYSYDHPNARRGNTLKITRGGDYSVADAYFGGTTQGFENLEAQAAMAFASLVDVTRVWHEGDRWDEASGTVARGSATAVPFRESTHGVVKCVFPKYGSTGRGHSSSELWIGTPGSDDSFERWLNGELVMHEYGHVLHQRTWETGYGYSGDPFQDWSGDTLEQPLIAFKEAWANFVRTATLSQSGDPDGRNFQSQDDQSDAGRPYGSLSTGHRYPGNVSWFLMDWADSGKEDDPDAAGEGDQFTASLYSTWYNLNGMWSVATSDEKKDGLGLLEFIDYYLYVRKSSSAVGAAEHNRLAGLITSMATYNGIGTGLVHSPPHAEPHGGNEQYVELNPFGEYSFTSTLTATDVDSFLMYLGSSGEVRIRVRDGGDAELDPALVIWRLDPDTFVINAIDSESGDDDVDLRINYTAGHRWQLNAYPEFENAISTSKSYTVEVAAPAPSVTTLTLDAMGRGGASLIAVGGFAGKYIKFTAPSYTDGTLTLTVEGSSGTDVIVTLYDASGTSLARADSASDGGTETITYAGVVAGANYYARIGTRDFAAGGVSYEVKFGLLIADTMTRAEGQIVLNNRGDLGMDSPDVQIGTPRLPKMAEMPDHAYIRTLLTSATETDSFYFAVPSGAGGNYTFRSAGLDGTVDPLLAVYDADTGEMLGLDDDSGTGTEALLTITLEANKRYIVAITDAVGTGTGDVDLRVEAPASAYLFDTDIGTDGRKSWSNARLMNPTSMSFWKIEAPSSAKGELTITLTPDATLDADFVLFDETGAEVGKSAREGTGGVEELTLTAVAPGDVLYLTMFPRNYASTGYYAVNVEFDVHTGSISGVVFEDADADGVRDPGESGLGLQVVYIDANLNGVLDSGEQWQGTGGSGEYEFAGLPLNMFYYVRVRIDGNWAPTTPVLGYHHEVPTVSNPDRTGDDFGLYLLNSAAGTVFEDANGDGAMSPTEAGLFGVTVFVDLDGDGVADSDEPSATANLFGEFLIEGIPAGTHKVRVEERFGYFNLVPADGTHEVTFVTNESKTGLNYALRRPTDFGDAPEGDYHTLASSGGAYHTIIPDFHLGSGVDDELDGHPSAAADGDDRDRTADEDGLTFIGPMLPGSVAELVVTTTGSGVVDIWIDFNGRLGWESGEERITGPSGVAVAGSARIAFTVPAGAVLGKTYVRARFSGGGTSSPDGFGNDGEVEDYQVTIGTAAAVVDADRDEVPDSFELAHYASTAAVGPDDDTDRDGLTTREEWLFGTIPTDPGSRFHLELGRDRNDIVLRWRAIPERRYRLEMSQDLKTFAVVADGLTTSEAGWLEVRQPVAPSGRAFYRVRIEPGP